MELLETGSLEQLLNFGRGKPAARTLLGVGKGIAGDRHYRGVDCQHSRINSLKRVNNRVVSSIVITGVYP
jgi:hypothetical protein